MKPLAEVLFSKLMGEMRDRCLYEPDILSDAVYWEVYHPLCRGLLNRLDQSLSCVRP